MKVELYPHNLRAYESVVEIWKSSNKVAVVQATGTGKSYLILRTLYDRLDDSKIVIAPSKYILDQLISKAGEIPLNTEFMTYTKLSLLSPDEISKLNPSLIVLDEFHRCGAEIWGKGVQTLIESVPNAKIIGTSATPVRYLDGQRDMSDELFEGNVAVNLTLADAIVQGIIPMLKYISALYTFDEEVDQLKAKIDRSRNNEESKAELWREVEKFKRKLEKSKGIPQILKKYCPPGGGKYIVFCKDKMHLNEMVPTVEKWFRKAGIGSEIESYSVAHGYVGNSEELERFRNNSNDANVRLLFSIEMMSEGIHIDDMTGVILLRPTTSPIIYYQQIGRALQAGNRNEPLVFDFVNNFKNVRAETFLQDLKMSRDIEIKRRAEYGKKILDIPDFTIIDETIEALDVFTALENEILSSRPNWDVMFEKIKNDTQEANTSGTSLWKWANLQRVCYNRGILSEQRIEKLNSINFAWSVYESRWDLLFQKVKFQYETNVSNFISNDEILTRWCNLQRSRYFKGILEKERIEKLESIGFSWAPIGDSWDKHYDILTEYKLNNGHCIVPMNLMMSGFNLGSWVFEQRKRYKNGKLSKDRITRLNELNFLWDPLEEKWMNAFLELINFKESKGHFLVPRKYKINGVPLGEWVYFQRMSYKENKMKQDRIDRLNAIDFKWELNNPTGRGEASKP